MFDDGKYKPDPMDRLRMPKPNVTPADINALLERQIASRSFGVFGEPSVNVLDLNLALQRAYPRPD